MRKLKTFENFNKMNEGDESWRTYVIDKPGEVAKNYKIGVFGPEFDTWMTNTNAKAKEKNWESWGYTFATMDNDPRQQKIYFMVCETPTTKHTERVKKGVFQLDTKKGTITD